MSRKSRIEATGVTLVDPIKVGEVDEMSLLAARFRLPACSTRTSFGGTFLECTRAAGHHESKPDHASTPHVAAVSTGVAMAVWS